MGVHPGSRAPSTYTPQSTIAFATGTGEGWLFGSANLGRATGRSEVRNEGIGSISRRSAGLIRRRSMLRRGDTSTPHHRGPASHEPAGAMRHHQVRTREFGAAPVR
ncbi:hypothetical protein I552_1154 [Mycobacterium xenopi 3993]|nr:hypothetical protein I552_1154 [Mycobacterium xenopi 3993]